MVHSDLKPDNILIREDGPHFTARLIDFGSAFSFDYPENLGMATPESAPALQAARALRVTVHVLTMLCSVGA